MTLCSRLLFGILIPLDEKLWLSCLCLCLDQAHTLITAPAPEAQLLVTAIHPRVPTQLCPGFRLCLCNSELITHLDINTCDCEQHFTSS